MNFVIYSLHKVVIEGPKKDIIEKIKKLGVRTKR